MASTKSVKLDESKFKEAVRLVCNLLQVDGLYDGQEEALKQFFRGKNIFFSAHKVMANLWFFKRFLLSLMF